MMTTSRLTLVLLLQGLGLLHVATASCPRKCRCESRDSEFLRHTTGTVLNCSAASLTDTHVTDIDDGSTVIIHLDLSSNQIVRVDKGSFPVDVFRGLQQISLGNNTISSLDADVFAGLAELRSLSLGANNLTTLPAGLFATNTQLSFLDLSDNVNLQLPPRGFNLTNLAWLDLSRCGLEAIPPSFFAASSGLQYLYLSHNRLTQVAPEALRAVGGSLRYLDLYDNRFTRLQPELLQVLPLSCKLFLYDNPFHCDCDFLKAYAVYKRRAYVTVLGCDTPEVLHRTRADELGTVLKCD